MRDHAHPDAQPGRAGPPPGEAGASAAEQVPLVDEVTAVFAPGGPLERLLPGYEVRPGQVRMARAVAEALEHGRHLAVEAATGIGKTLAYLVPAVLWARRHHARVVVATHTLALQDQLRTRDLPLLQEALPVPFTSAVLKGFSQYACRLQAAATLQALAAGPGSPGGDGDEAALAARVAAWLEETDTGEASELADPAVARLWPRLATDAAACLGAACPLARGCFPLHAREQAQRADLVITNHALLLADRAAGGRLLPDYDALIVDEAHHLEDVAAQQLGARLRPADILRWLEAPAPPGGRRAGPPARSRGDAATRGRPGQDPHEGGLLALLTADREAVARAAAALREVEEALQRLAGRPVAAGGAGAQARAGTGIHPVLQEAHPRLHTGAPGEGSDAAGPAEPSAVEPAAAGPGEGAVRLPRDWSRQDAGRALAARLQRAGEALAALVARLDQLPPPAEEHAFLAARQVRQRLQAAVEAIDRLLAAGDWCVWIEAAPGAGGLQLAAAPVLAADLLAPWFETVPAVLTSATLPRGEDWLHRLGVRGAGRVEIPSPFDFRRQALLAVVADGPRPPSRPDAAYAGDLAGRLLAVIDAIPGGVLVLFTARWAMLATGQRLRPALAARGRRLAIQDRDGPRSALVAALLAGEIDVLMGVDSLWEGIDVPGPRLEGVILTRLPFDPPADPLTAARCEAVAAAGGSPFFQYQLPRAAVKLKQGFGRLVRGPGDRGVVVVFDPRLAPGRSGYAGWLLDSLPPASRFVGSTGAVVDAVREWFRPPAGAEGGGEEGAARRAGGDGTAS